MPDGHALDRRRRAPFDGENSRRCLLRVLMRLDNGLIDPPAAQDDVLRNRNTGFGVDGILKLDNGALCRGIAIEGCLDGVEVAANRTDCVRWRFDR